MRARHVVRTGILALALASASCGSVVRQGTGTSFLIIEQMEFASGAEPDEFRSFLLSDVITVVDDVPSYFNDLGRVRLSLGLKDPGPSANPTQPTQNQYLTVDRYRVKYIRSDGRNAQGVDVPHEFEGGLAITVGSSGGQAAFNVVRHIAKREAPLKALTDNGVVLSTIAEITFYGRDQTGHAVQVTGRTSIEFGNFGDPD